MPSHFICIPKKLYSKKLSKKRWIYVQYSKTMATLLIYLYLSNLMYNLMEKMKQKSRHACVDLIKVCCQTCVQFFPSAYSSSCSQNFILFLPLAWHPWRNCNSLESIVLGPLFQFVYSKISEMFFHDYLSSLYWFTFENKWHASFAWKTQF